MSLGMPEVIIILIIILLLFGTTRIPKVMRGLGQGISEFKKGVKEFDKAQPEDKPAADPPKKPDATTL